MIDDYVTTKRALILDSWCDSLIQSYSPEVSSSLKGGDCYRNPAGSVFNQASADIFDYVTCGGSEKMMRSSLNLMVRLRTVQGFRLESLVEWVYHLMKLIQRYAAPSIGVADTVEWTVLENKLDSIVGLMTDMYKQCLKDIERIRLKEEQNRTALAQRMQMLAVEPMVKKHDHDESGTER